MFLTLLNLIQAQAAQGIPWYVWAGAALIFLIGISLVVYFFLRLKKTDKEPEDDWTLSSRSLFANAERPVVEVQELSPPETQSPETQSPETQSPETVPTEDLPVQKVPLRETEELPVLFTDETATLSNDAAETEPRMTERLESAYPVESRQTPPVVEPEPAPESFEQAPPLEDPATQLLGSSQPPASQPVAEEPEEETPFDDIWNELLREGTSQSQTKEGEDGFPPDPPLAARVEQRPPREPFEPPQIKRVTHREPFEPPSIMPIEPGEHPAPARPTRPQTSPFGSRETSERKAPAEPLKIEPSVEREHQPVPTAASSAQLPRGRKPAGSVLGLPTESTGGPLVFGEAATEAATVGSLNNYGKDMDKGGGHGGTIALVIAVLLVGGGLAAYFYVPAVHAKVNAFVSRMRGDDRAAREAAARVIRAQVYPVRRPEVDKNIVKAKGEVYNITAEPLEGLSVEVTIERYGGGPPEVRTVPVTPDTLVKDQQGIYEFEYDGKENLGYRITKLNTSNGPVRFSTPQQPKS